MTLLTHMKILFKNDWTDAKTFSPKLLRGFPSCEYQIDSVAIDSDR